MSSTELRVEHTMLYAESVTTIRQCGECLLAISKRLVAAPFERGLLDGKLKGVKLCKEGNERLTT